MITGCNYSSMVNFIDCSAKLSLTSGHRWVVTSHRKLCHMITNPSQNIDEQCLWNLVLVSVPGETSTLGSLNLSVLSHPLYRTCSVQNEHTYIGKTRTDLDRSANTPFTQGLRPFASIVRPQNWPGRRWRQKGSRTVTWVVQWWYTGRSEIAMDAMVAVKFWACSKQLHKGHRGGWSLTGRSKEAGGRHTHRRGGRMDAQWSAISRPVKNTSCCEHCVSIWAMLLPSSYHHCASFGRPIASIERSQWRPLSLIRRPRQPFSHLGNGSASTLPPLRDLLRQYSSFGRSMKAQGSCCSSYTETELSGFGRPLSVLTIFLVAQRWHEDRSPV